MAVAYSMDAATFTAHVKANIVPTEPQARAIIMAWSLQPAADRTPRAVLAIKDDNGRPDIAAIRADLAQVMQTQAYQQTNLEVMTVEQMLDNAHRKVRRVIHAIIDEAKNVSKTGSSKASQAIGLNQAYGAFGTLTKGVVGTQLRVGDAIGILVSRQADMGLFSAEANDLTKMTGISATKIVDDHESVKVVQVGVAPPKRCALRTSAAVVFAAFRAACLNGAIQTRRISPPAHRPLAGSVGPVGNVRVRNAANQVVQERRHGTPVEAFAAAYKLAEYAAYGVGPAALVRAHRAFLRRVESLVSEGNYNFGSAVAEAMPLFEARLEQALEAVGADDTTRRPVASVDDAATDRKLRQLENNLRQEVENKTRLRKQLQEAKQALTAANTRFNGRGRTQGEKGRRSRSGSLSGPPVKRTRFNGTDHSALASTAGARHAAAKAAAALLKKKQF
jgi:hypothetical protein